MVPTLVTTANARQSRDDGGRKKAKRRKQNAAGNHVVRTEPSASSTTMCGLPDQPPPPYEALQAPQGLPAELQHTGHSQDFAAGARTHADMPARSLAMGQGTQASLSSPQLPPRPAPRVNEDCPVARGLNQGAAFFDQVAARLSDAISRFEGEAEAYDGLSRAFEDMAVEGEMVTRGRDANGPGGHEPSRNTTRPRLVDFSKTWMYANSRLPPHLPPLTIYMPTWRIICVAARASQEAYKRPQGEEREDYIDANWRDGTKAMVLKSKPIDDQNLIVLAIRGSQKNFIDWAVNFRPAPTAPNGLLEDHGNACHAGFLSVARATIAPIAARLRTLLEQDPSRASSSLLLTGHSAGGAVAALLYMHMIAPGTVESELNILTGCFKRVHCVTFGAPPVSLLPLQKPAGKKLERSVFMSFANEGDPVIRADKAYIWSLARLLAAPTPASVVPVAKSPEPRGLMSKVSRPNLRSKSTSNLLTTGRQAVPPSWPVPPATLSNAGRLIVLRERLGKHKTTRVEAVSTTDEQLRGVVFGDPSTHTMALYRQRVEALAVAAVTGKS